MRVYRTRDNKEHMCDYCVYLYPKCNPSRIEFWDNNIVACSNWSHPSIPYIEGSNQIYIAEIVQRECGKKERKESLGKGLFDLDMLERINRGDNV